MLVELKNGETFNGHLVNCDNWMNLTLREVIQTSSDGDRFWRLTECYIRGNTIKYLRVPDEIIDLVKEDAAKQRAQSGGRQRGGGGNSGNSHHHHQGSSDRGGRGGGRGGRGDYNKSGGGRGGYNNQGDRGGRGGGMRGRGRGASA
ncbi:RNA processing protein [Podila epicladia]|nr:RNA processing protein [Podila epicladia]KAG0092386.1 RNA processing protein [Podila epicladia]